MNTKTFALLFVLACGLFAAVLLGKGIHGMVTYSPVLGEICQTTSECGSQVCCQFGASGGACVDFNTCQNYQKEYWSDPEFSNAILERPWAATEPKFEMAIGILILILVCFLLWLAFKVEKLKSRRKEAAELLGKAENNKKIKKRK